MDVSNNGFPVAENVMKIVRVGALTTYTTLEARELSIQQRKCRYPDENNLRISPVYTFNFCQMECRMKIARQKCNCIPHFYRKTGNSQHVSESREVPHAVRQVTHSTFLNQKSPTCRPPPSILCCHRRHESCLTHGMIAGAPGFQISFYNFILLYVPVTFVIFLFAFS
jgi:hypothetical protein